MLTRRPTPTEQQTIAVARYLLIETRPYYAALLFQLPILVVDELPITGTDRRGRVYLGTPVLEQPPSDLARHIEHELNHLIRCHTSRLGHLNNRAAAGLAACLEINDDLNLHPQPSDFHLEDGNTAEWYYRQIENDGSLTHPDSCGSGSGDNPGDWELDDNDPTGLNPLDIELASRAVAEELLRHHKANPGNTPAGLLRWAEEQLAPPVVPWRDHLRSIVRGELSRIAGRTDYSMQRPSRRPGGDLIRPSMIGHQPRVTAVVDTSGSMSQDDLTAALSEVQGVINATGSELRVLACDTEAADGIQEVRHVGEIVMRGGGGTDMTAGIATALSNPPTPHLIIVLTDGLTGWPACDIGVPLIVAVVGDGPDGPQWATTVRVPLDAAA